MSKRMIVTILALLVFIPLIVIWALRALGAHTSYSFESWLAVMVLSVALKQIGK